MRGMYTYIPSIDPRGPCSCFGQCTGNSLCVCHFQVKCFKRHLWFAIFSVSLFLHNHGNMHWNGSPFCPGPSELQWAEPPGDLLQAKAWFKNKHIFKPLRFAIRLLQQHKLTHPDWFYMLPMKCVINLALGNFGKVVSSFFLNLIFIL